MLTKKEAHIIQYLNQNKERFVTSRELAGELNCSDRTIRNYFKSISDKLPHHKAVEIISKQGNGYQLHITDEKVFDDFLKDNHIGGRQIDYLGQSDINDRYNYILNKLLFEQNEIYFDDLADEMFVSRSTLSADFKKIRKRFQTYHLKIESKANKGVFVTGTEQNKRRFIIDHFIDTGFMTVMHSYVSSDLLKITISFEELTLIVIDECREGCLKLSDFVIQNLVIHIALALRRVMEGFEISQIEEHINLQSVPERAVAARILNRITLATGINFPVDEIDYITLHLISKGRGERGVPVDQAYKNRLRQELVLALDDVTQSADVKNDFQLLEGLLDHLMTLKIRLESRINLENPLSEDVLNDYSDMYALAQRLLMKMPSFSSYSLTVDENAYIALHFMAARERYKEEHKFNILVICATGYGSAQMLKSRIQNELGSLVHVVDVIGYYDITDEKLQGIDFIMSSIDLSNLIFNIPVYTVSVFLTEVELQKIRHNISHLAQKGASSENSIDVSPAEDYFEDYFSEDSVLFLSEESKESVVDKLLNSMANDEDVSYIDDMKAMIARREQLSSVVFSETIAVPHPIKALSTHHRIGVAIVKDGVSWSPEFSKIHFVFLTSMSVYDNEGLPELASMIVDLIERKDIQEEMLNCQDYKEFKRLFLKIKKER